MRLFAIGDIQGCAAAFDALLRKIAFRPSRDRLWLVGDLVNRGPDSLAVLRRVMGLGRSVTCVLGNHDLHLLATVAGRRELSPADTFRDVLEAPDLGDDRRLAAASAAAAPRPRARSACSCTPAFRLPGACARRAPRRAKSRRSCAGGNGATRCGTCTAASRRPGAAKLRGADRRRYTINALTRMRYCDRRGRLDLSYSGAPGTQPKGLIPWFDVPDRRGCQRAHIVFGHWAALGLLRRARRDRARHGLRVG